MKTTLHTYSFNLDRKNEAERYRQLCDNLRSTDGRGHIMKASGSYYYPALDGAAVEL